MVPLLCGMWYSEELAFWYFGAKIFLLVWIVFVPVVMTRRLEQIIKLLKEKK